MFIKVRAQAGRYDSPSTPAQLPCIYMLKDRWDDYSYSTTFTVYYFDDIGNQHHIGPTKILDTTGERDTELPAESTALQEHYCSLGQSLEYYESWFALGVSIAVHALRLLRDVVADPELGKRHEDAEGFQTSLLRFSEAAKAYREAGTHFGRVPLKETGFEFDFRCRLEGFTADHHITFNFTTKEAHPHRLTAFVGKNGTGKSGVLARLAEALSGLQRQAGVFEPGRPQFSRTLCLSYSVFQPFEVPKVNSTSYRYCGLKDKHGIIDPKQFDTRTLKSIENIWRQGRNSQWLDLMQLEDIFSGALPASADDTNTELLLKEMDRALKCLSSGQRIVVSILSDLLEHISKQSLILLDEPEVYLHPTLLSTLLRLLHTLLDEYDSYAIVATHSPIVIQEIPARSVRVFTREGMYPIQASLPIESLGENLTDLVDTVFAMNEDDKNYKTILRELKSKHSYEEILSLFDGRLSLNARMFLKNA